MTRRHPNVINVNEAEANSRMTGAKFGFQAKLLAGPAGAKQLGGSWYEVPAGRAAFPFHFHCANEEAMFILEGRGTVRIGDARVEVGPGDWLSFPAGPATAHQVIAGPDGPLRFLGLSTAHETEVVAYPDSKKIAARSLPPGRDPKAKPWVLHITGEESSVDYWDREAID
jgi:uncharacterized cupin superfamily protein